MNNMIFATAVLDESAEKQAVILANSLRRFGGRMQADPFWVFCPAGQICLSQSTLTALKDIDARVQSFTLPPAAAAFPFGGKVFAAAAAEALAEQQQQCLVWLDPDTLILQEPQACLLPENTTLGCCPVHHTLIGSPVSTPLSPFWEYIYKVCGVALPVAFETSTLVENDCIRPYYNAGLLAVCPQKALLRHWLNQFQSIYNRPEAQMFYEQNRFNRIFMHQAVLAGVILARLKPSEVLELPASYNYPLHLHHKIAPHRQPGTLNNLITCRYDDLTILQSGAWRENLVMEEPVQGWLSNTL